MNSNGTDARQPLLNDHRAGYDGASHSRSAVSSLLDAGHRNHIHAVKQEEAIPEGKVRFRQIIASIGILLSAGAKIAHMVIQYRNHEVDKDWFIPVPGMLIIYWLAAYALQIDYVYMLGHPPKPEDPPAYSTVRAIAFKNVPKFFVAHLSLFLWQLFAILNLPILSFVSVTLSFFILIDLYNAVHRLWREHGVYHGDAAQSPSFLQGPASSLLVFVAIVHMPSALIVLITTYYPNANLDAIEWPLAWWMFFINLFGSYFATRTGYSIKRANESNTALQLNIANEEGVEQRTTPKTVPVDLAAVIGLFWASLAVAAGTGSVNWGPVMVIGYIGAMWQALALFGGLV
ncbi:hypothetical protein M408DRAFT_330291 [Serendipita vermifera MAFF 305830]|uniref:Uncharacterized protein n=1 Tax=Serendipita vermifera MAFF 305830 TaxID=933852 RepID=A0A0C3B3Y9_SERVB|nr:hypothetical protein M408DRAFT_330291 [Serendipita vermifera MAFF 305830]